MLPHSGTSYRGFDPCVICGSYGLADFLLNILLFLPLGRALQRHSFRALSTLGICLGAALFVELSQLWFIAGRQSALSDIIANSLGGVIGWTVASRWSALVFPRAGTARILLAVQILLVIGSAAFGGWIFQLSTTPLPYWGQIAPPDRTTGSVDGLVTEPQVNGEPLVGRRLAEPQSWRIATQLAADTIELSAGLTLHGTKWRVNHVVRVVDGTGEELAMLGLQHTTALFSVRTRATDLRLSQPALVLSNAFACDSCDGGFRRDSVLLVGSRQGATYTLRAEGDAGELRRDFRLSGNLTWATLIAGVRVGTPVDLVMTFFWLWAQGVVLGYWLLFAIQPGGRWGAPLAAGVLTALLLSQVAIPAAMDLAPGTLADWTALLSGVMAGVLLARRKVLRVAKRSVPNAAHEGRLRGSTAPLK
jgi:hypothetical protein